MKKRLVALVMTLCVAVALVVPAGATEINKDSFSISSSGEEYIDIAGLVAQGNEKLIPASIEILSVETLNEYDMLVNYKDENKLSNGIAEQELMARAKMTDTELYDMGYTKEGISILRNYDGSPIEENPQLRAATASLTGVISKIASNSTSASAKFSFSWSQRPVVILAGVNDYISCIWIGTNSSNGPAQLRYSTSSCTVKYSDGATRTYSPRIVNSMYSIQVSALQSTQWNATGNYIKSGSLSVYVREQVTANTLRATEFGFNYGHSTIAVNGGVTILPSPRPSFSLGIGVSNTWESWKTVR